METKASYVAVGAFVLLLGLGIVGFVVWLGALSLERETDRYLIHFTGTVTGLQVGSPVSYRGIPVGQVTEVRIDPDNIEQVEVVIEIAADTPVKVDSIASLELQGITGGVYILISGGTQDSPRLEPIEGRRLPVIRSRPSTLQQLVTNAPELLAGAARLLNNANRLLSGQNQRTITQILEDVRRVTSALAERSDSLAQTVDRLDSLTANLDGLVAEVRVDAAVISDELRTTLTTANRNIVTVVDQIEQLSRAYAGVANQIAGLIAANRESIQDFTSIGLYEFTQMVSELRGLAQNLSRVAARLERDPAQFLFGTSDQGVSLE